jgi:murein DD-endopeptidase MepM/ murein hydrolase activator NlpD
MNMKQRIRKIVRKISIYLKMALTNDSAEGSGAGVYIRTKLKRLNYHQVLGVNLAGLAFFAGIVVPQTREMVSSLEVAQDTKKTIIVVEQSASLFHWPLHSFGISQNFSVVHPGMDLTDPVGTPIYPITDGVVTWTKYLPYGYGSHVLVTHSDGVQSLYAHMSKVFVREGQGVTKNTPIGLIGVTGWTTGSHLHFEVYDNGTPTNPIEILPGIKL